MNILGIDYGSKNIGLALTRTGLDVILPFGKIINSKSEIINQKLLDLIKKEKINYVVVGWPIGLDGTENENTQRVREFADKLKECVNIPIEFVDERFSSRAADVMAETYLPTRTCLRQPGVSRDERAAMVILETYLGVKKNQ